MEFYTVTSTGRLIKFESTEGISEYNGSEFVKPLAPIPGWILDTRDEARDFNDFASALKFWKSLSDSNK